LRVAGELQNPLRETSGTGIIPSPFFSFSMEQAVVSHYEERLQQDIDHIRTRLDDIYQRVTRAVRDAVDAVAKDDKRLANLTVLGDRPINRGIRRIERLVHEFVVRHIPSAKHLRWVSSVLRVNVALERVGDYAVDICREQAKLREKGPPTVLRDIETLGRQAERVLTQSIQAFAEESTDLARSTIMLAEGVEDNFTVAFDDLTAEADRDHYPNKDLFAMLIVLRSLKRVSDQAINVCERTLFAVGGEAKGKKSFRILFVDERNDGLSQIAEAYAEKVFLESGKFTSAGWNPADEIAPEILDFMDRHGLDIAARKPTGISYLDDRHRHYHVIIGLNSDPRPHLEHVPFRTALLEWEIGPPPPLDADDTEARLEDAYRRIAEALRELMEVLEGSEED